MWMKSYVLVYRAPHSYTREDMVEIQGHGGRYQPRVAYSSGGLGVPVLVQPSLESSPELAFLNGRIDLLEAEAVLDIIQARTDRAATMAVAQLEGRSKLRD